VKFHFQGTVQGHGTTNNATGTCVQGDGAFCMSQKWHIRNYREKKTKGAEDWQVYRDQM